jgi:outer membrane biogenesis lipoprotein LolB
MIERGKSGVARDQESLTARVEVIEMRRKVLLALRDGIKSGRVKVEHAEGSGIRITLPDGEEFNAATVEAVLDDAVHNLLEKFNREVPYDVTP